MPGAPISGEVICHNDIAPWNTVFIGERPSAFLDWDAAAPGPCLWDVAYAAWHRVPLWADHRATDHGFTNQVNRGSRLRLLCEAYGLEDRGHLVETILRRQQSQIDEFVVGAGAGNAAYEQLLNAGACDDIREDMALVEHHRREWDSLLA